MSEAQGKFPPRMWIRFKRFSYEAYFDEPDKEKYDDLNLRRYVSLEEAEAMVEKEKEKLADLLAEIQSYLDIATYSRPLRSIQDAVARARAQKDRT